MFKALEPFVLSFIPIFVAVDAIGTIPLYLSMTEGVSREQRRRIISGSVKTATSLAVIFMIAGKFVLSVLGITIPDFQIAGGSLLFIISVRLLLPGSQKGTALVSNHDKEMGIFPLGTPLITGPAVLTTTLMMLDSYGIIPTFTSLVANMLIVWVTLAKADSIMKIIGTQGTRAFSKIVYVLLAAIGVMMIRRGLFGAFLK